MRIEACRKCSSRMAAGKESSSPRNCSRPFARAGFRVERRVVRERDRESTLSERNDNGFRERASALEAETAMELRYRRRSRPESGVSRISPYRGTTEIRAARENQLDFRSGLTAITLRRRVSSGGPPGRRFPLDRSLMSVACREPAPTAGGRSNPRERAGSSRESDTERRSQARVAVGQPPSTREPASSCRTRRGPPKRAAHRRRSRAKAHCRAGRRQTRRPQQPRQQRRRPKWRARTASAVTAPDLQTTMPAAPTSPRGAMSRAQPPRASRSRSRRKCRNDGRGAKTRARSAPRPACSKRAPETRRSRPSADSSHSSRRCGGGEVSSDTGWPGRHPGCPA
jgi:hypothetical protein